ncbi:MAG: SDR family NAD(P)-dependent oxidoreductase [Gammaproteobacteria bacterium]|nr:MAG: SDR family NAD(P)-dependent oxidoreductase [Gammaproteobacteria bacterium]
MDYKGKVAVITGAASGIGRALALKCAGLGMKIVIADIEEDRLTAVMDEIFNLGGECLVQQCDVSSATEVKKLADATISRFGKVNLLFNNAGVSSAREGYLWEKPLEDWEWIMGVNLWGVIHGIREFTPVILDSNERGHIVNTASIAGLTAGWDIYGVTKHAVVSLSENLKLQLERKKADIGVSVLCPAWVNTDITNSFRNHPNREAVSNPDEKTQMIRDYLQKIVESGISPEAVADIAFNAIANDDFYILTHSDWTPLIKERVDRIMTNEKPETALR